MNNFDEMPFGEELLVAMYNTPSKQLTTEEISGIITAKTGQTFDPLMTSKLFNKLGMDLRKRQRTEKVTKEKKEKKVTKAERLNSVLELLGVGGDEPESNEEEFSDVTEQEQQSIDEAIETRQFDRENRYSLNGVA